MADKPIDLARVRAALAALDRLAKEHPELTSDDPQECQWDEDQAREIVSKETIPETKTK